MTKLSNNKIRYIVKTMIKKEATSNQLAKLYGVSRRRIQQLAKEYLGNSTVPMLNPRRRPTTELTVEQICAINDVWDETKRSSRLLWFELRKRGYNVPKNKIHSYLRETGKSIPNPRKQKKRKRCRYEREHSGSLLHTDWHRKDKNSPHLIGFIDDASRKVVAAKEFDNESMENSIVVLKEADTHCKSYSLYVKQLNADNGSVFTNNRSETPTAFECELEKLGITPVYSRPNNPQTNGKLERFWYEYDKHRFRFKTLQEFVDWYNDLIHGELDPHAFLTPKEAFMQRMPPESLLGMFDGLIKGGE